MSVPPAILQSRARSDSRFADYLALTKPRITLLVLVTTYAGMALAATASLPWLLTLHTLLGTALVCAGTSTLNQVWERDRDARMRRTALRPLPAARLHHEEALSFGVGLAVAGMIELALFVNLLAALVAAATLALYLFVYTPLKTRTWLCTVVGAVPGALPPVIGWTAVRGNLDAPAWVLFAILFVWQLPHFFAIAWMYREDYARAGFPMLAVVDPDGRTTSSQILSWSAALVPASVLPAMAGLAGWVYTAGALILGIAFMTLALGVALHCDNARARRVFLGSILYLPALSALLVFDRLLQGS
jgi:protoheme IX farnesyltransferase